MPTSDQDSFIIAHLITRYQRGELSTAEQAELDDWLKEDKAHQELWEGVNNPKLQQEQVQAMAQFDEDAALERFLAIQKPPVLSDLSQQTQTTKPSIIRTFWFRYAAVLITVIATGAFLWFNNSNDQLPERHPITQTSIAPGKDGAILTLSNGVQVALDSLNDGLVAEENGSLIQLKGGSMRYNASSHNIQKVVYNTMTTPIGRQYHFFLPDGTKVWLNAGSSITYPTSFTGSNRQVSIKGELYFDVAQNANQPFIVQAEAVTIQVLGTEFNINCYENETNIQTTLINGLVKLVTNDPSNPAAVTPKLLHPGKQANIARNTTDPDPIKITEATNLKQVIAWKEGLFNFNKVDLFHLMRQLERWYNIEVEYQGEVENVTFRGQMYRNVDLSVVINELRKMDVSIEQQGSKLIIKKY